MPTVVRVHAVLVVALLALNLWAQVQSGAPRRSGTSSSDQVLALIIGSVFMGVLFFLMLRGKAWARVVLGILTLPAGLLLLVPLSAREYTDPHFQPERLRTGKLLG